MADERLAAIGNADQIESWNDRQGQRWAALQETIDALFAPLTDTTLDFAAPRSGDRVLDVGCGCGATVLGLSHRVGHEGSVLGIDVSTPMLAVAARRIAAEGRGNARVIQADASTHAFQPGGFDLVFSRFGVMFFDHPAEAFRHLAGALKPGGRLAFVCWQNLAANDWFRVPIEAVASLVGDPPPGDPDAPGPLAFARPDRVRDILTSAGLTSIAIRPHAVAMRLGGPGEAATAADFLSQIGAAARLLAEADPSVKAAARVAIADRLAGYDTSAGIVLGGAVWLVSAQAA